MCQQRMRYFTRWKRPMPLIWSGKGSSYDQNLKDYSSNNSWTTLASLLRFKENRFYIIIYFYSSPKDVCLISTIGLASWNKLEPANRFLQIGIGGSAIFKVSIIARPFPKQNKWHWTFSASNIYHSVLTHPPDLHMVINDRLVILNITNVTRNHYGTN